MSMPNATKPVLCFTPKQGQYALGAQASQHRELGHIVFVWLGDKTGPVVAGDQVYRMPAAQAIEFALLLEATARRSLAGAQD